MDGKRALITGASRGIGKAIARALAQEGVDVVIAARNLEPLTATALELATATGRRIMPLVVDTGDDGSVQALIKQATYELGGIDILVNNAATGHARFDDFQKELEISRNRLGGRLKKLVGCGVLDRRPITSPSRPVRGRQPNWR